MRISYETAVDSDGWVQRVECVCQLVEHRFGISLIKAHSGTKHAATTKLIHDRRKYLHGRLKTASRWFCFFSGSGYKRTDAGLKNVDYFAVGGSIDETGNYRIEIVLPDDAVGTEQLRQELAVLLGKAEQSVQPDRA